MDPASPDDERFQYGLLDLLVFVGLVSFMQGLLMWLSVRFNERGEAPPLSFHVVSLPATLLFVFGGVSWGIRTAREGQVKGALKRLGLHLLGVGATLGLLALGATVALVLVCALAVVGALAEVPFAGSQPAESLPELALLLAATTALSSLLLVAGWLRRRLRRRAGYDGERAPP